MSTTQNTIEQTKQEFLRAKDRVVRLLKTTPDDRINWSPSPTARTPVQIVAHVAEAIKNIHGMLDGRPFPITNTEEADKYFREMEKRFNSREQVLACLEDNCANYVAWLDALPPERLDAQFEMPFGMGNAPVSSGLGFPTMHTQSHIPQLEYIQTIYGDRDWHF
jgi:hypothetical protein